ncbi:MAG TPA: YHS domain-containing protein [Gemmataceae bacterium]|nr:YHS domain-containing protein [Gemmataceae bacterium]
MRSIRIGLLVGLLVAAGPSRAADQPARRTPRQALQAFNDLIGSWRATGEPEGTFQDKQRGFWTESLAWAWRFKGDDAWLEVAIDRGKHFRGGELRYLPDKDRFRLDAVTADKVKQTFEGPFANGKLTLERHDDKTKETQRLVVTLLHANRFLYRYEVKAAGRPTFKRLYQVGCTKEGVPFAVAGDSGPECVVSGGRGTIPVTYKGQTYYVCCTGCRDAFKEDPEKYLKEYAERKAKEAKENNR